PPPTLFPYTTLFRSFTSDTHFRRPWHSLQRGPSAVLCVRRWHITCCRSLHATPPRGGQRAGGCDGREPGKLDSRLASETWHDAGRVRARDRGHRVDGQPLGECARRAQQACVEG